MEYGLLDADDLALCTDLYELTMAAAFLEAGAEDRLATFDVAVRTLPDERGYLLAAGLEQALAFLHGFRFSAATLEYLEDSGHFRRRFLDHLASLRFTGDVDALPEGTVYFPEGPLVRVTAPIIEAQLLETCLLTLITFQTMIASKAARLVDAARGRDVVDFSPRRDHGPQAGLLCARAAYIGGCVATSNVLANRRFGIPVTGTMAHSFVMFYRDEVGAFRHFCRSYPGDPTLLIDTYDTLQGATRALELLPELRADGRDLGAVRLDSGDLGELAGQVRVILDDGGAQSTRIVASGNLDEHTIARLLADGAPIDGFGVGTQLGTSGDAPSLDSTYKLAACTDDSGAWRPVIKLSPSKVSLPGRKQIWRRGGDDGTFAGDVVALEDETHEGETLLEPVMRGGRLLAAAPELEAIRERARDQRRRLPAGVRRLEQPDPYPVRLSTPLRDLIERLRQQQEDAGGTGAAS